MIRTVVVVVVVVVVVSIEGSRMEIRKRVFLTNFIVDVGEVGLLFSEMF